MLTCELPKNSYRSKKIIGELFRRVQSEPSFEPSDIRKMHLEVEPALYGHPQYREVINRLMSVKNGYECDMHFAMRRFRATELEIVTGIVTYDKQRKTARDVTNTSVS